MDFTHTLENIFTLSEMGWVTEYRNSQILAVIQNFTSKQTYFVVKKIVKISFEWKKIKAKKSIGQ